MDLNKIPTLLAQIILAQATHFEHVPECKIEPGEIVIGTIDDPITRSLYSIKTMLDRYGDDYASANETDEPSGMEKRAIHLSSVVRLLDAVDNIFWHRIHEQFDKTKNSGLMTSIREGWQVVVWKSSSDRIKTHVIDLRRC